MKALIGILVMLSATLTATASRAEMVLSPVQTPQFCMQNFNAYGPIYAPDTYQRMEWIGSLLQAAPRCGVIQLQEVWNSSNIDQIENALKYNYQISSPNRDNKIGVMSLFDGDIKGAWTYQFRINNLGGFLDEIRETFGVTKAFHIVQTRLPGIDEDFYFVNTHLHPTSTEIRITQILDILKWRLQNPSLKMLMSGDFNANEKSFERDFMMAVMGLHDSFADALGGSYPPGYCSYCETNPHSWMPGNHMLDYIFVSNAGGANSKIQAVAGELNMRGPLRDPLSDHYGVRVSFKLVPGGVDSLTGSQWIQRRDKVLAVLSQAQQILVSYDDGDLDPYIAEIQGLSAQIQSQQGPYYQYFGQFR